MWSEETKTELFGKNSSCLEEAEAAVKHGVGTSGRLIRVQGGVNEAMNREI